MSFCFIIFICIFYLVGKMSMKVGFVRKVHNNVQIGKAMRILKKYKKNNKIQTNQNIKSVQDRQRQEMILK
jgi:hypothetical protein